MGTAEATRHASRIGSAAYASLLHGSVSLVSSLKWSRSRTSPSPQIRAGPLRPRCRSGLYVQFRLAWACYTMHACAAAASRSTLVPASRAFYNLVHLRAICSPLAVIIHVTARKSYQLRPS